MDRPYEAGGITHGRARTASACGCPLTGQSARRLWTLPRTDMRNPAPDLFPAAHAADARKAFGAERYDLHGPGFTAAAEFVVVRAATNENDCRRHGPVRGDGAHYTRMCARDRGRKSRRYMRKLDLCEAGLNVPIYGLGQLKPAAMNLTMILKLVRQSCCFGPSSSGSFPALTVTEYDHSAPTVARAWALRR